MAVGCPIGFDVKSLRAEVQTMYSRVAAAPDGEFHFHRGPGYAASMLGYDAGELAALPADTCRVALDNVDATTSLSHVPVSALAVLAIGPERGWTDTERATLRESGFELVHLGPRVLRTETATVAGLTLLKSRLGLI